MAIASSVCSVVLSMPEATVERSRRLYDLWSWLVPFRAVAETESLAEASKSLHITPSALSRSVKLLEEHIGHPLFLREPAGLRLTEPGRQLLTTLREAMRLLDDTFVAFESDDMRGTVTLSGRGELFPLLLPLLGEALAENPQLLLSLSELSDEDALAALRRGVVDLAVVSDAPQSDEVLLRPIKPLARGVFCAPGHLWATSGKSGEPVLKELSFGVLVDDNGVPRDGFPLHIQRKVLLKSPHGATLLQAAADGQVAVCVPERIGELRGLVELPVDVSLDPLRLSCATRQPLDTPYRPPGERLAERLLAALGEGEPSPQNQ